MKPLKLKLVLPDKKYLKAYQNMCRDFIKNSNSEKYRKEYGKRLIDSKNDSFFSIFNNERTGKHNEKGKVLQSRYWVMMDEKMVGRISLRHSLKKEFYGSPGHIGYAVAPRYQGRGLATIILREGLRKAKKLGLKKVLLVCDKGNLASRKVIEKNKGKLTREAYHEKKQAFICFYWITL